MPVFLFDLDNTLYDADRYCFPWMHIHINSFLMRELDLEPEAADRLRRHYWRRYGTTLAGLMRHHPVDPRAFLEAIHPPVLSADVPENPRLRLWLSRLPGPVYVFTNSSASHAWRVLERLQVADLVEEVFDMESADFQGKPHHHAYRQVLGRLRIPAWRCVFFDDTLANLRTARWLGMQTVHIEKKRRRARSAHQQVHALLGWEHGAASPKTCR
ncbi:pyrimidine 5'-nucleotidase [Acidithiobacillus marinus]|uniref:pyrimidine 5'-nucleotidase n=1 Tax=Acidithiobacillus marinus TaxID=187490 RepID=UPI00209C0136|nr:pyrimidine 5'-nucleotidase [Acidithiobacillus marinus]